MAYYSKFASTLKEIFDSSYVEIADSFIILNEKKYNIINDVIIIHDDLINSKQNSLKYSLNVQKSFSHEWETYHKILDDEHKKEFEMYFDIVDKKLIKNKRIADLGCGIGRWSYFLKDIAKELILIDFSTSIFIARKNFQKQTNVMFFMADITRLPFKKNFADFIFSLGVLHHIPQDTFTEIKKISEYAPVSLIFLYYNLDNRPVIWKVILKFVTLIRSILSKTENKKIKIVITKIITYTCYLPLINIGKLAEKFFSKGKIIPLYEFYKNKTIERIEQDVYDRFFTSIEKRFSRKEIENNLKNCFTKIIFSEKLPYWHFLLIR
ncbi:MAG: class I SAM-dependent methyltransferase [Elusimicrobiales bacterium]|nr:class I SAM-dependent methyltransferase [Elusimicrobiales bacterium]